MQRNSFIILFLLLISLLGYLAAQYRSQWDVSQSGRNSLSEASIEILQKMHGSIQVTAYATEQHAELGDIRKIIHEFVSVYQRVKPDMSLTFVDPIKQPQLAQAADVKLNGEVVIGFDHKVEHLTLLNEQAFSSALMRLARAEDRLIVELGGHGERRLDGYTNYDLGEFGKQLRNAGFNSRIINLIVDSEVPKDAHLLLIASPRRDWLPGEIERLVSYIDNGGNLLWLIDQEPVTELLPLAEKLRLTLTPGIVVDPRAEVLKVPMTFAIGTMYGQHAITDRFDYFTVFPFARQVLHQENEEWHGVSLVEVAQQGWIETDVVNTEMHFDRISDVPGPVVVAVALTRTLQDREQRIVVVGSGHFLANSHLGNGGNLDFGINIVNWLAGDDELIVIQPRATLDHSLMLSEVQLAVIAITALVLLPVLFLFVGIAVWWRRRARDIS